MCAPQCIENTKFVIGKLTCLRYYDVTNFEKLFLFFPFIFWIFVELYLQKSLKFNIFISYVVLNVNPLQNKVNSKYDHCFARCMYEFKYICNLWIFLELLLTL